MHYRASQRLAILAVVLSPFGFCTSASAQGQLSKSTKAGHEIFLEGYARTNSNCEDIDPPEIYLDQAPEQGFVCLRRADVWLKKTVEANLTQCLRRKASGIHVIYQPRHGYIGADKVRYIVRFPTVQHTVEVNLTVLPDVSPSGIAVSADVSVPNSKNSQPLGPIPMCSALVS